MANFAQLKAAIQQAVDWDNHNNEISGLDMLGILNTMINSLGAGYMFAGVAKLTPTQTDPGTPDQNVFYIAAEPGSYTNFPISGGYLQVAENEVAIFKYNGQWSKETTGAATAAQVEQLGQEMAHQRDCVEDGANKEFRISDGGGNVIAKIDADGNFKTKKFDSETTTPSKFAQIEWGVTDADGNVIVEVNNGHIKTKFFNSALSPRTSMEVDVDYTTEVAAPIANNSELTYGSCSPLGNFDFDFKWVGGCLARNGRIYGIVNGNRQVIEINPKTNTYALFGKTSAGSFKWTGCGIAGDGLIYGFPRSANSVLIINPELQTVIERPIGTSYGQDHHYGGCIVGKKMYLAPRSAGHILVIDLGDWSTYTLGGDILSSSTRYSAVCYHPNGYIYFIPESNAKLLKLDPATDELVAIGDVIPSCSVYGAAIAPNNLCIYGFTGYRADGKIMKIDPSNNDTMTWVGSGVGTGYYGCKLGLNGKIYSIVGNATALWELDPTDDSVTQIGTIDDSVGGNYNEAKCAGGALAEDGSIYMIPAKGRHIYKLSFSGTIEQTLSRKILSSTYFSNY